MVVVVVLDPPGDQSKDCGGVRQLRTVNVVALRRFHARLGDAIALRALHQRVAGAQAELVCEDARVPGDVTRAIVAQQFDWMRCPVFSEPLLDRLQYHVADIRSADAGVYDGPPRNDIAFVRVDNERTADDIAVPAGELEAIGAPADVRADRDHLALAGLLRPFGVFASQQETVHLHDAVDAPVIDGSRILCP